MARYVLKQHKDSSELTVGEVVVESPHEQLRLAKVGPIDGERR